MRIATPPAKVGGDEATPCVNRGVVLYPTVSHRYSKKPRAVGYNVSDNSLKNRTAVDGTASGNTGADDQATDRNADGRRSS